MSVESREVEHRGQAIRGLAKKGKNKGLTRSRESRGHGHEGVLLEFRAGRRLASRREGARFARRRGAS